jgi:hyperosmotically inducible protein
MRNFTTLFIVLILCLLVARPAATKENVKETASDIWLESKLVTSYTLNEHLNPFKLHVDVKNGVAYLSGSVDSPVDRDLAVEIAKGVDGINKVEDNIRIEPEKAGERQEPEFYRMVQDATITAKVKSKLLWNRQTHGLEINVTTTDGVVTLKGKVASDAHRDLALQLARNTTGVKQVKDQLQVSKEGEATSEGARPLGVKVDDGWITAKVKTMLFFSKSAAGSNIQVETDRGVVTLKGTVESKAQENAVKSEVGDMVGVKNVRSQLVVENG